jgi:hypothetical protein
MTKDISHRENLLVSLDTTITSLLEIINKFTPQNINSIPFEGSWTAAQVADHLTKSTISITRALGLTGTKINRDPDERIQELKDIFLNFSTKLKSPDFILPTRDYYEKEVIIAHLTHWLVKLKEIAKDADLSEMIKHPAFGDITKFEILHFVLYHTQRHTYQLKNIFTTVSKR